MKNNIGKKVSSLTTSEENFLITEKIDDCIVCVKQHSFIRKQFFSIFPTDTDNLTKMENIELRKSCWMFVKK